jgi:hypothetical protein
MRNEVGGTGGTRDETRKLINWKGRDNFGDMNIKEDNIGVEIIQMERFGLDFIGPW